MSRADITTILTKGSPRQRAMLIMNNIGEELAGRDPLLTEQEVNRLVGSFKKESEIALYNRYRRMFDASRLFCSYIAQHQLLYKYSLERLDKFILLKMGNQSVETCINNIIAIVEDKETKNKIAEIVTEHNSDPVMRRFTKDKEGFLRLQNFPKNETLQVHQMAVAACQITLKTAIKAIKDFFELNKFNVRFFKDYIRETEHWAKSTDDKGISTLYTSLTATLRRDEVNGVNTVYGEIFDGLVAEIDYKDVKIDEAQYRKYLAENLNV